MCRHGKREARNFSHPEFFFSFLFFFFFLGKAIDGLFFYLKLTSSVLKSLVINYQCKNKQL